MSFPKKFFFVVFLGLFLFWSIAVNYSTGYKLRLAYIIVNMLVVYGGAILSLSFSRCYVFILSFLAFIVYPFTAQYGSPNINMVTAVKYTNYTEALETVSLLPINQVAFGFFIFFMGIILCYNLKLISPKNKKLGRFFIFASLTILFFRPLFSPSDDEGFFERIGHPAYRFFYDIKNSLNVIAAQENETNKNKSLKTDYNPKKINMHYNNYILVIGESVRRDYMGVCGFKINNTPFLSKSNGIFFENYTSASFGTVLSLTNSLLYNNKGALEFNNNIIRLAKSAVLYTYWISNQGRFGIHDGPIAAIGKEADYFYFIKNGDSNDNERLPDEAVLPKISSALKTEVDKLVVVHLMGSHPDPCVRTGGHFNWWYHNKNKSCYIQSIRNTDRILEEITKLARSQNNNWTILYFADHGLSQDKKDGNLKHSDEFKENFMPPLVIINSDFNKKIRVTALRTGMDFIKMFAQWIGIEDNKTLSQCNYLSNDICYKDVNVIDKTGFTRSFSSLKNEEPSN